LTENTEKIKWYSGPSLIDVIETFEVPKSYPDKPLRIPIFKVHKISGVGTVAVGRIATGTLKANHVLNIGPYNLTKINRTVEVHHKKVQEAGPGTFVGIHIRNLMVREIKRG
jgi:elongation factor 1-alpha